MARNDRSAAHLAAQLTGIPGKQHAGADRFPHTTPHIWNRRNHCAFLQLLHPTSGLRSDGRPHQKKSLSQPINRPVTLPNVPFAAGRMAPRLRRFWFLWPHNTRPTAVA